jgi:hypothetical protein
LKGYWLAAPPEERPTGRTDALGQTAGANHRTRPKKSPPKIGADAAKKLAAYVSGGLVPRGIYGHSTQTAARSKIGRHEGFYRE